MPGLRLFTSNCLEVLAEKLAKPLRLPLPFPSKARSSWSRAKVWSGGSPWNWLGATGSARTTSFLFAIDLFRISSKAKKRELPFYKIGNFLRFRKSEIDAWQKGLRSEPS
jgi:hypothetical protein